MDELYLDNIDEYVNDQNKIVTYKWLSLTLGVHVNTAKQMLYHYLDQRRKERSGTTLHATYLVSGKCSENGSVCHKVSVVREDQLDDTKSKLDKTISVHVYSVQKAELKDSGPLYSTDYDAVKENLKNCNKYSTIRCAAAVPLSHTELQKVQEKVVEKEATKPSLNDHTAAAPKPSVKQPKGIMGMFSNKAAPKSEACNKEVKTEQKDEASPVSVILFGQTSKWFPCRERRPYFTIVFCANKIIDNIHSVLVIPDSPPVPEVQTPSPGNEVKKEPVSHQEASEGRRRKRRRVLKARTFLDDEGCMVTEKGYESESYSESEDDSKTTSQPSGESNSLKQSLGKREEEKTKERGQKKAPAAAAAANKSTKQSSIMGFFQKK
uniref:DNA polymerase delta subunit 3 n=1 Tax=Astyanax mexicanus TaxID=7994 RepID=A0A8B9JG61_ASTMX